MHSAGISSNGEDDSGLRLNDKRNLEYRGKELCAALEEIVDLAHVVFRALLWSVSDECEDVRAVDSN